jgi:hypothetical protein
MGDQNAHEYKDAQSRVKENELVLIVKFVK